jgi:hypothetical protein
MSSIHPVANSTQQTAFGKEFTTSFQRTVSIRLLVLLFVHLGTMMVLSVSSDLSCQTSFTAETQELTQLEAEHIFEKQGVLNFIRTTISGFLPDNRVSSFPGIDPSFWVTTAFHQLQNVAPIGGGELAPIRRIFTVLGADNYRDPFVLAGDRLNGVKATLWGYNELADPNDMNTWVLSDPVRFLNQIRFVSLHKILGTRVTEGGKKTSLTNLFSSRSLGLYGISTRTLSIDTWRVSSPTYALSSLWPKRCIAVSIPPQQYPT